MADILYIEPNGRGWAPIHRLVQIATRTLGARLIAVKDRQVLAQVARLGTLAPRLKLRNRALLVVAPNPAHLSFAATIGAWFRYDAIAAWVIDSFWTQWIPGYARTGRHFDHIFVTDRETVPEWEEATSAPVHWLPWGADTALINPPTAMRDVDLLRIGRQPPAWDNDKVTAADSARFSLRFAGRPPFSADDADNHRVVQRTLRTTKFVLAFSNLVSPTAYTHPSRDYLTGRWTDALANGATVAGLAPQAASSTLWDGATVSLDPDDRDLGFTLLRQMVNDWTPDIARHQMSMARRRLDWRLRIQELVTVAGWPTPEPLRRELLKLAGMMD